MTVCWMFRHDVEHLRQHGVEFDLRIEPGPGTQELVFTRPTPLVLPQIPVLRGNLAASLDTEYPVIRPRPWPVVSRRLRDVLVDVGPMPAHEFLPVIAEAVPGGRRRDDLGLLHLLEHVDAIDRARSELVVREGARGPKIDQIRRLELVFTGSVPSVFRLVGFPRQLFVSEAARLALTAAGVRGCVFAPISMIHQA